MNIVQAYRIKIYQVEGPDPAGAQWNGDGASQPAAADDGNFLVAQAVLGLFPPELDLS